MSRTWPAQNNMPAGGGIWDEMAVQVELSFLDSRARSASCCWRLCRRAQHERRAHPCCSCLRGPCSLNDNIALLLCVSRPSLVADHDNQHRAEAATAATTTAPATAGPLHLQLLLLQLAHVLLLLQPATWLLLLQHQQQQFLLVLLTSRLMWHYQLPQNTQEHRMHHIFIINIFMFRIMVNSKLFLLLRLVCHFVCSCLGVTQSVLCIMFFAWSGRSPQASLEAS